MKLRDLVELTKPKVTALNIAVGLTCFALAGFPSISWVGAATYFLVGYMVVGGCGALNCYLDRDIDAVMERTRQRAIPTGRVAARVAFAWGAALVVIGLAATLILFGTETALYVSLGSVFYLVIYTLWLKRSSRWNVVIGAAAGSFAALSGWSAAGLPLAATPLLVGLLDFLWTPGHLWSLAIKRVEEYREANVPMLPVASGVGTASRLVLAFNASTVVFTLLLPVLGLTGIVFAAASAWSCVKLMRATRDLLSSPSPELGGIVYLASMPFLGSVMLGLLLDRALFLPLPVPWR